MNLPRSHSQKLAEPGLQPWSSWLSSCTLRFGDPKTDIAPRPRWGPRGGKKADLRQLGHAEPSPPGMKGQHRHSLPSTLSSQVGKGPDHLSGATLTPSPRWALSHCRSDSPCNHGFLFGAETGPGQWGRGADTPLARACSGGRGAGSEAYPASWNLGRLGAKARGGGVSQQIFTRRWPDVPRMWWNIRGDSKTSQVVWDQHRSCSLLQGAAVG